MLAATVILADLDPTRSHGSLPECIKNGTFGSSAPRLVGAPASPPSRDRKLAQDLPLDALMAPGDR